MKEKYLQEIQRKMFWKFTDNEIDEVLEDINFYFVEASKEKITDEQFMKLYGTPKEFVSELIEAQSLSDKKRNKQLLLKIGYVFICVLCIMLSILFVKQELSVFINMVLISALIWFFSSCKHNIKINKKENAKMNPCRLQILFWSTYIFTQLCTLFLIPFLGKSLPDANKLGKPLFLVLIVCAFIVTAVLIPCVRKMQNGNIHMFFMVIEFLSLLYSLFLYNEHLKKIDNLNELPFLFYPCIIAAIINVFYEKIVYNKEKLGKWMFKSKKAY